MEGAKGQWERWGAAGRSRAKPAPREPMSPLAGSTIARCRIRRALGADLKLPSTPGDAKTPARNDRHIERGPELLTKPSAMEELRQRSNRYRGKKNHGF